MWYGAARPGSASRRWTAWSAPLTAEMLLITDDSGPIAIAGVMGGAATEVSDAHAAYFAGIGQFSLPQYSPHVAGLRLPSEAAQRFGRGVDSALTLPALVRAAA